MIACGVSILTEGQPKGRMTVSKNIVHEFTLEFPLDSFSHVCLHI